MSIESSNFSQTGSVRRTWAEGLEDASARFDVLLPDLRARRVAFLVDGPSAALDALVYALHHDLDFGIIEASRVNGALERRLDDLGISRLDTSTGSLTGPARTEERQGGRVSVMTSGTTGLLKPVAHTWQSLNTLDRVKSAPERFWFVPYQPGSYAWYQMICLSLFRPAQHLYCADPSDPVQSFRDALEVGVTAITSTPTFWRCAFMAVEPSALQSAPLETITLGGEIVDQAILDQLAATYPKAAIRHIYASSEAGAAIVVTDGRAGFPVSRLGQEGIGVKVKDGRLFVRSSYTTAAAAGRSERWVDTGDVVEVRGDRVYFLGRDGVSMINVGGMKAFPAEIEAQLMRHPNVVWAQVHERRAPLVGSLPAARIVLRAPAWDPTRDENELAAFARECLPEHAVPRAWRFLTDIPMQSSLKAGGGANEDA